MPRPSSVLLSLLLAGFVIGGPIALYRFENYHRRNLRVVREGVLYRSGQLSLTGLKMVIHDHGIRTVISLRDAVDPGKRPPDWAEEQYCRAEGIQYVRISPRNWWAPDGSVPAEVGVREFREIMDNPQNFPVLIHCLAGIHRTGAFCAVFRMEYDHWTNAEAIAEMRACGYKDLEDEWDLLGYLEDYRPRWMGPAPAASPPTSEQIEAKTAKFIKKKRRSHNEW